KHTVFLFHDTTALKEAERNLKKRNRQLEFAQSVTNIGSWEWDLRSETLTWTDELYRIYGYDKGEVDIDIKWAIGRMHSEDQPRVEALLSHAIAHGEAFGYQCRLIRPNGEERIMDVRGHTRKNGEGKVVYLWGTAQDVTDIRRAHEERERALLFSERIIDQNLHGIAAVNQNAICIAWNPTMSKITDIARQDVLGQSLESIFNRYNAAEQYKYLLKALRYGETVETEFKVFDREDDSEKFIEARYAPLVNDHQDVIGGLIMWNDVTERQTAVRELQKSEENFRTIFNAAGMGIVQLAEDGKIMRANPSWYEVSGHRFPQLPENSFFDFLRPKIKFETDPQWQALLSGDQRLYSREMKLKKMDGTNWWVYITFTLLRPSGGGKRQMLALIKDIHQRKSVEAELKEIKRRLAKSREKARLHLAQDLHDGPIQELYATIYQLQALKRLDLTERQNVLVDRITDQFQQVNDTIRAICRDLRPPTLSSFGLESAIRAYAERFQALYPDITITLNLYPDQQSLPEYVRLTLYRICQEMLSNIAKHAQATRVLIRFEMNDHQLLLEIQDNGQGFEVPEKWIEPARDGHFGLVGAAERAEEVGGQFALLSSPGRGTIIRVNIPYPLEDKYE
ncbi:MAG: PAS domain S-box protein, partial [Anaerolineales bacterium]|nr:PAS domain S-box protein [Anaerolineales bacterium]